MTVDNSMKACLGNTTAPVFPHHDGFMRRNYSSK